MGLAHGARLGPCGPGLLRWPAVDPELLTADEVRAHLARYFNADNAVVTLTAPPPQGLRLPLPVGPPVTHAESPLAPSSGPSWYADEVTAPGIALSATSGQWRSCDAIARDPGRRAAPTVRSYALVHRVVDPGGRRPLELGLSIQLRRRTRQGNGAAVAQTLWQELCRLATEEPSPKELHDIVMRLHPTGGREYSAASRSGAAKRPRQYERAYATAPLDDAGHLALNEVYDEFGMAR
jgi:hypothetical protein